MLQLLGLLLEVFKFKQNFLSCYFINVCFKNFTEEQTTAERVETSFETQILKKTIGIKSIEPQPRPIQAPLRLGTIESSKIEVQVPDHQKAVEIVRAYHAPPAACQRAGPCRDRSSESTQSAG